MLYVPVNSYGHVGTVRSSKHTFFLGKLNQAVKQYFVHILKLVTDNNPSWISRREENGHRNDFTKEWDRTCDSGSAAVKHVTDCATRPGI